MDYKVKTIKKVALPNKSGDQGTDIKSSFKSQKMFTWFGLLQVNLFLTFFGSLLYTVNRITVVIK